MLLNKTFFAEVLSTFCTLDWSLCYWAKWTCY